MGTSTPISPPGEAEQLAVRMGVPLAQLFADKLMVEWWCADASHVETARAWRGHQQQICDLLGREPEEPDYAFGRPANDLLPDDRRQELKLLIPRLVGTVDPGAEAERAEYLALQAIRGFAPLALEAAAGANPKHTAGLRRHAAELRGCQAVEAGAAAAWIAAEFADKAAFAATRAADKAAEAAEAAAADAANSAADRAAAAAAAAAAGAEIYDAVIASLHGVLRIGRQAPDIASADIERANRSFALARA